MLSLQPRPDGNGSRRARLVAAGEKAREFWRTTLDILHTPVTPVSGLHALLKRGPIAEQTPLIDREKEEIGGLAYTILYPHTSHKPEVIEMVRRRLLASVDEEMVSTSGLEEKQIWKLLTFTPQRELMLYTCNTEICYTNERITLIDVVLDSKVKIVGTLRGILHGAITRIGREPGDAVLALSEIATNAVKHGNALIDKNGRVIKDEDGANKYDLAQTVHAIFLVTGSYAMIIVEHTGNGVLPELPTIEQAGKTITRRRDEITGYLFSVEGMRIEDIDVGTVLKGGTNGKKIEILVTSITGNEVTGHDGNVYSLEEEDGNIHVSNGGEKMENNGWSFHVGLPLVMTLSEGNTVRIDDKTIMTTIPLTRSV